jgi:uncharacterized membrane protein
MFSTYALFKFLHIVGAIVWIGGITILTLIYTRLTRTQERSAVAALAQVSSFAGQAIVGPAAALTLIFGIVTAATAGFEFSMLWITWGFAGIIASIALGASLIRRVVAEIGKLATAAEPHDPRLRALQGRLTLLNLVNLLILLSTVGAMVFKPTL